MRISLVGLFVDDQEKARKFYTEGVGLQVHTEAAYGPGDMWLTIVSPEEPNGVQLSLHTSDDAAREFQRAAREAGRPMISLSTDDCQRDFERRANGVVFTLEPTKMEYGGTDAVFDDTCGNLINLHQD